MPFTFFAPQKVIVSKEDCDENLESMEAASGSEVAANFFSTGSKAMANVFLETSPFCGSVFTCLPADKVDLDTNFESMEAASGSEVAANFFSTSSNAREENFFVHKCPVYPPKTGNAWDFFHIPI